MSTTQEVGNDISLSNYLLAALVPDPFPSTYIFPGQTEDGFALSSHPPNRTVDASIYYPSINLGDGFEQPLAPAITDFQSDAGSVAAINRLHWDGPTREVKTISGGTFISGNVNYIHATVIPPSEIPISIVLLHFYLDSFRYLYCSISSTD
jgi:hypothetical protein